MSDEYKLSDKYLDFLEYRAPVEVLEGTTAAGKTTVGILKFMLMVAESTKKMHVIAAKTTGVAEKNIIQKEYGITDVFGDLVRYNGNGDKDKLVLFKDNREFITKDLGEIVDGKINEIPRYYDTEAKFFEFLNDRVKTENINEIFMLSEKSMCESCKSVTKQFIEKYPNVKVNIVSGRTFDGWKGR